ncbi:urea ABC transporter permease subunit UrtB [Thetidibacter halocola]|uniref:Urea ABC transporter permease subunit UrtB n=1 Tax=Thetidibacter halocola TaxID=2827239 RepID=A0A8J8B8J6_9RHOB|nr:urea ABC transporter permease subunit UrtB [Thetidibacter halocola]MBS0124620.1 urea ABC transporter permease subunit UrtB [Thetidibacter halocola]
MLRALVLSFLLLTGLIAPATAQTDLQTILQTHAAEVESPGRQSVGIVLNDLAASGLPGVAAFLEAWQGREVVRNAQDGLFYRQGRAQGNDVPLLDIATGAPAGTAPKSALTESRPNGGVRREIASALVRFQLSDPDIAKRSAAVDSIARSPDPEQVALLAESIDDEPDPALKMRKEQLALMLTARFGETTEARVEAIEALAGSLSLDVRATLNQILTTTDGVAAEAPQANIARLREPGIDMPLFTAYRELVDAGLAPPRVPPAQLKEALAQHVEGGTVAGIPLAQLSDPARREEAYQALAAQGLVAPTVPEADFNRALEAHVFYSAYAETDPAVTDAARRTLDAIQTKVGVNQTADIALDALSLASIYFLAAIGLAITFGVMGVINMAHGEFIMMGAYTGYVVQLFIPNYTLSLVVALPLAFAVTFAAGVAMERLVIRWLYHRPLETLLATFGISIALQQLAKNIFGTQARPLTSPGWLDGALVINEVIQISYIRIAIFVLALIFLGLILFALNRTRLGLEVRAVTQNPGMAASMGIDPDRINMLTFGLGSGIAGIAGVAIGLYAKVTSEMGQDYIVQSFMTVVVGGVGNVWGTLAGATLIGGLQKGIEWFNPSNTLAAQTYMILFIILFIQFRPKGIVALKGRAAGD